MLLCKDKGWSRRSAKGGWGDHEGRNDDPGQAELSSVDIWSFRERAAPGKTNQGAEEKTNQGAEGPGKEIGRGNGHSPPWLMIAQRGGPAGKSPSLRVIRKWT